MRTPFITALVAGIVIVAGCGGPASHAPAIPSGQPAPQVSATEQPATEDATEAALRERFEAAKRKLDALLESGRVESGTDPEFVMAFAEYVAHATAYHVYRGSTGDVAPPDSAVIARSAVRGTTAADLIDYLKDMADGGPWGPEGNTWQRWPQLPLWKGQPTVRVRANVKPEYHRMTAKAVDMINDWLPVEHRMVMGTPTVLYGDGLHPTYGHTHPVWDPEDVPAGVIADSGPSRSPIPAQADHSFRFKPITDSGRTRSPIPVPSRSLFGDDRNRSGRAV